MNNNFPVDELKTDTISSGKNNKQFIDNNFLLGNKTAQLLYHEAVENLPIIDYHCHLPVAEIASNRKFDNLTQVWLYGDHYKWRAMRTNGINEKYCTGEASDWEKFKAWAETVPYTLRNPLYHWSHMELKKPFGITDKLLDGSTANEIWDRCNALLSQDNFTTQGLITQFNVEVVCTTDDPVDSLEYHQQLSKENHPFRVYPAFRPDKGMAVEDLKVFKPWFNKLQSLTNFDINSFSKYIEAIKLRHDYFHENHCRLSDHGLNKAYAEDYTSSKIEAIFAKIVAEKKLTEKEIIIFKSAMMYEFAIMDSERGWVQQLHIGALRNNNLRMLRTLGPDTGWDSIGDWNVAEALSRFLDKLDNENKLAKTILYNLNPADNEVFASMIGNFQDGTIPGKMQWGSAWWFLDQLDGMRKQLNTLSVIGLLSRFIGMTTDSRSFLSYPRHDYFRRLVCSIIGEDVEKGLIPDDMQLLSKMVSGISYHNAKEYFGFDI